MFEVSLKSFGLKITYFYRRYKKDLSDIILGVINTWTVVGSKSDT